MNIAFDAKRAFLNQSGLGNYSRTLIRSLAEYFPSHQYTLFTTKSKGTYFSELKNLDIVQPERILDKKLNSRWRSYRITELLTKNNTDIYHGLSNELPFNIGDFKGKKIVTIHDLIFLRYPKLYPLIDRKIYNKKFKHACNLSDIIVATSEQTKNDIATFYSISPEKIKVVYQSCNPAFYREIDKNEINRTLVKFKLPKNYLLSVGTIEERKNLESILKALTIVQDIPLVVVGKKKAYFKKIQKFIKQRKLESRIYFLDNIPNEELPAIYKGADIFIYPSLFEGFGIPIIESLTCGTPVITSKDGCFFEAGGKNSIYIDPTDSEQLAGAIHRIYGSPSLRKHMIERGIEHSKSFLPEVIASEIMNVYKAV